MLFFVFPNNLLEKIGGYLAMVGKSFDWDLGDQRGGASGAGYIPTTLLPFGGSSKLSKSVGDFFEGTSLIPPGSLT